MNRVDSLTQSFYASTVSLDALPAYRQLVIFTVAFALALEREGTLAEVRDELSLPATLGSDGDASGSLTVEQLRASAPEVCAEMIRAMSNALFAGAALQYGQTRAAQLPRAEQRLHRVLERALEQARQSHAEYSAAFGLEPVAPNANAILDLQTASADIGVHFGSVLRQASGAMTQQPGALESATAHAQSVAARLAQWQALVEAQASQIRALQS